jgi:hypothetical protein
LSRESRENPNAGFTLPGDLLSGGNPASARLRAKPFGAISRNSLKNQKKTAALGWAAV